MRWVLLAAALALTGCSDAGGSEKTGRAAEEHQVFEVGKDLHAGVYTAPGPRCTAVAASSGEYDLMTDTRADDWLRGSMLVGDRDRIEVRRGEFLHTYGCRWSREDGTGPRTPDPATLAGRCAILTGPDHLAETSLSFAGKPVPRSERVRVGILQLRLQTVGFQMGQRLSVAAGTLVDVLDDPKAYTPGERIRIEADRALATIRLVCHRFDAK
jgi:hypothetical protein